MALAKAVSDVFIVAAKRTPFGTYGGKLLKTTPTDLQEIAFRAVLDSSAIKAEQIQSVVVGNVFHSSIDGAYMPRHAAIRVGIPAAVPAYGVNRLCGSGFQSIANACQEIETGLADIVLTGGSENMSMAPHICWGARFGSKLGEDLKLVDALWQGLIDHQINMPMGITAENLAEKYNINREDCNRFALRSQQLWKKANDSGVFESEMAPITLKSKKGDKVMNVDEHPRVDATLEQLEKLPPVFKKDGTVNAANASGICDGAGAVLVASGDACKKHDLKPLARIVGYGISGCDPTIMGIGPVPAVQAMLKATKTSLSDVGIVEINEAFAAQTLAVMKELDVDPDIVNPNGGGISIGHPVGASGSRITAHLAHEINRRNIKYAVGSACIGGGQGISVLLENVNTT